MWCVTLSAGLGTAAADDPSRAISREELRGVIKKEVSEAVDKAFDQDGDGRPATLGDVKEAVEEAVTAAVSASVRTTRLIERGGSLYRQACQTCHGAQGDGRGEAARHLDPRPRDLRAGVFKFRTTRGGSLPVDADLARTIRVGVPGTSMPAFGPVFEEAELDALVAFIKTFSPKFRDPAFEVTPDQVVRIPAERPSPATARSPKLGREVYTRM
ncbi:MAG: cytochrome c, partial [Myxococcales bacterium]|nr:cytochrome c [Myxococcales bacterium]